MSAEVILKKMEDSMNNLEAMEKRKSVRSYCNEEVEGRVITQLRESLVAKNDNATKGNIRFEIITGYNKIIEAKTGFLFGLGKIYAPAMIVAIYEEKEDLIEIGFRLEQEVLFLMKEGYGSCFLGTYDEKVLRTYCSLEEREHIGVVLVFGKSKEESRFMNSTFRNIAGSSKRKDYREILLNAEEYREDDRIVDVVKHAIMAPSGNNRQPVRIVIKNRKATFYLIGEHLLDLGIFMAHFYLCCSEIYDSVKITKTLQLPERVDVMQSMAVISWQERKTCQ